MRIVGILFLSLFAVAALGGEVEKKEEKKEEKAPEGYNFGLIGEYFDIGGDLNDFPDVSGRKPKLVKVDKMVNFESTDGEFNESGLKDKFFVRWSGQIQIEAASTYRFYTESDDGSRLFIDGKQIVDNAGLHGMEEKEGDIDLSAGMHDIRIEFFDSAMGAGCKINWERRGHTRQSIPGNVLIHKKELTPPPPPKKEEPKK